MSILSHTHPSWCHPRACTPTEDGVDHRQAPVTWTAGDHSFSVGLCRHDATNAPAGATEVAVVVEDLTTLTPSGDVARVETYLSGAETQLLAAALSFAAALGWPRATGRVHR